MNSHRMISLPTLSIPFFNFGRKLIQDPIKEKTRHGGFSGKNFFYVRSNFSQTTWVDLFNGRGCRFQCSLIFIASEFGFRFPETIGNCIVTAAITVSELNHFFRQIHMFNQFISFFVDRTHLLDSFFQININSGHVKRLFFKFTLNVIHAFFGILKHRFILFRKTWNIAFCN